MHRFAHRVVTTERKRNIADAAADFRQRQVLLDPARRFDKVDGVVVVLFDARADGEDVRVEDDILRRKSHLLGEDLVGAGAHLDFSLVGIGLADLVESHNDNRRAVAAHESRLRDEFFFALFEAERIDDGLALHALEPRLDDFPF